MKYDKTIRLCSNEYATLLDHIHNNDVDYDLFVFADAFIVLEKKTESATLVLQYSVDPVA